MMTGICLNTLLCLISETRHHDIDENDVGLMIGDFRQRIESVDRGEHLASLLGQERLGGTADSLAIVDHQDLESREFGFAVADHALHGIGGP
jgi:hypothetical protein